MSKNHIEVWNNCLKVIRDNVNPFSYKTWFEPIIPLKLENNVLTIQVPSSFFYEYIEEKYIDLLSKILRKEIGEDAKLEYNIVMDNNLSSSKPYTIKLPTKNISDLSKQDVPIPISTEEKNIKNPFIIPGIKKLNIDPQLNPDYSFENFIEGDCNRLARSAGFAVACNPLFIYSANGLGKSHLSQAIGIEAKKRFPDKIVLYVQAHKFVTQFMEAIRSNNSNDFVHFYQMIDVLIIDDVHDFAGKEKTQDIFFHIFNHLHQLNRQLILTADKAPVELQGFEPRLLSRFKWGLAADLQVPDFETRLTILKRKIYNDGIEMPEEVLEYIASHITTNVREMEGALISILAQSTLNKKEITVELAKQIIDKIVKSTRREVSIDYIQKIVCDYFNISVDSLKSKTRKREIVQARQVAMYFAKTFTKNSLAVIGSVIGGKDHATVLHACRTVQNLMDTDKKFKQYVDDIEKKLKM